jgi:hypothetical protein
MMARVSPLTRRPAVRQDFPAAADVVIAYERSLYGDSTYAQDDLEAEWELGAFQLYESAGMRPTLGWVMFEKRL